MTRVMSTTAAAASEDLLQTLLHALLFLLVLPMKLPDLKTLHSVEMAPWMF